MYLCILTIYWLPPRPSQSTWNISEKFSVGYMQLSCDSNQGIVGFCIQRYPSWVMLSQLKGSILNKQSRLNLIHHPTDITGVSRFLGLASYYRRFVPNFAVIASPMNALTKKNTVFRCTEDCDQAFAKLKKLLTTVPVLSYPRFGLVIPSY